MLNTDPPPRAPRGGLRQQDSDVEADEEEEDEGKGEA